MPEVDEDVAVPVRALGRFGLVAYGVVHVLIAALVVQIAFGDRERADKKGALAEIGSTAAGVVLLWVITVGLAALVVWQLGEAVLGHRGVPTGQRAVRVAVNLGEAAIFGVLAYSAASVAASTRPTSTTPCSPRPSTRSATSMA